MSENSDRTDDTWDPAQYERFREARERPVHDLLALVQPAPQGRAVDLGCGTGRYTPLLHERVGAAETLGIDSSARMLEQSADHVRDGIRFEQRDLRDLDDLDGRWDVVFANAALQWLPAHEVLLPSLVQQLSPGGQLAVQVPANFGHPSHTVADAIGREFGLEPLDRAIGALSPARYAEILWTSGLRELDVTMRIYGVEMDRTDDVIEWVSGTLLTSFERRLDAARFTEFRTEYRRRLLDELGDPDGSSPYYYAFPRILFAGRLPA